MINNYIILKINNFNSLKLAKLLKTVNINVYEIINKNNNVQFKINYVDYKIFNKFYAYLNAEIIAYTGPVFFWQAFLKNIEIIITILLMIILVFLASNLIVDIHIDTTNNNLKSKINYELAKNNIDKFTFKKNYEQLQIIKKKIKKNLKEEIEWIEITKKGMIYIVNVEPKKIIVPEKSADYCNIISTKSGLIKGFKIAKGNTVVQIGDYVSKNDVLISGDIIYNDEVKNMVCAAGDVYAEIWYKVKVNYPLIYTKNIATGKKSLNYIISINDNKYQLFKNKYSLFKSDYHEIFNFLGIKFIKRKDTELKKVSGKYSKNIAYKKAMAKAEKSVLSKLNNEDIIIDEKVLQKSINNSKIELEVFIVTQEQIGKQEILVKGETYDS